MFDHRSTVECATCDHYHGVIIREGGQPAVVTVIHLSESMWVLSHPQPQPPSKLPTDRGHMLSYAPMRLTALPVAPKPKQRVTFRTTSMCYSTRGRRQTVHDVFVIWELYCEGRDVSVRVHLTGTCVGWRLGEATGNSDSLRSPRVTSAREPTGKASQRATWSSKCRYIIRFDAVFDINK